MADAAPADGAAAAVAAPTVDTSADADAAAPASAPAPAAEPATPAVYRVFVASLDSYLGGALVETFLAAGHTVVGTLSSAGATAPEGVVESCAASGRAAATALAVTADVLVFNLENDMAACTSALSALKFSPYEGQKTLVGVSTVMTWGRTTGIAAPFAEAAHAKRGAPGRMRKVKSLENTVLRSGSASLRPVVVGAGIAYGRGEELLEPLFRDAWLNCTRPALVPTAGSGKNVLPMVHVTDLARIVAAAGGAAAAAGGSKPLGKYVLAVDGARSTLGEVATAISGALGSGETTTTDPATSQMMMLNEPRLWGALQQDLTFDAASAAAHTGELGIEWVCREGLVAAAASTAADFVATRNLRPLRVHVVGPPHAGKAAAATHIAEKRRLPLLTVRGVLEELCALQAREAAAAAEAAEKKAAARAAAEEAGEEVPAEEEETEPAPPSLGDQVVEALTKSVGKGKEGLGLDASLLGRVPEALLAAAFRWKIAGSLECRNFGFVAQGYPQTRAEAEALFLVAPPPSEAAAAAAPAAEGEEEAAEAPEPEPIFDESLRPAAVIVLDGDDSVLEGRAAGIPEEDRVEGLSDEAGCKAHIAAWRSANPAAPKPPAPPAEGEEGESEADAAARVEAAAAAEAVALRGLLKRTDVAVPITELFDAEGVEVEVTLKSKLDTALSFVGAQGSGFPFNYADSSDAASADASAAAQKAADEQAAKDLAAEQKRVAKDTAAAKKAAAEAARIDAVRRDEAASVKERSVPLRTYLMDNVIPVLTQGLITVCRDQPEDPVDFLAEWLFAHADDKSNDEIAAAAAAAAAASKDAESKGDGSAV